mmetsp:Transcript_60635/g.148761  ORF Transcript_60635/g.148761 Transcript_60635/m.148761 type:complete len:121 (-) Transcript_60635:586-948(-)
MNPLIVINVDNFMYVPSYKFYLLRRISLQKYPTISESSIRHRSSKHNDSFSFLSDVCYEREKIPLILSLFVGSTTTTTTSSEPISPSPTPLGFSPLLDYINTWTYTLGATLDCYHNLIDV